MIKLYNRDGADLWLEQHGDKLELKVDKNHEYCLKYIRVIGNFEAVDPPGGPMISIGDTFNGNKIIKILNPTTFLISNEMGTINKFANLYDSNGKLKEKAPITAKIKQFPLRSTKYPGGNLARNNYV